MDIFCEPVTGRHDECLYLHVSYAHENLSSKDTFPLNIQKSVIGETLILTSKYPL